VVQPVMPPRIQVGRDVRSLGVRSGAIELEGYTRLRPGRPVEVILGTPADPDTPRRAIVWSWTVVAVGRNGPLFRGVCHWT